MATSPLVRNTDLVSFSITSNGRPIKDTYQVLSIQVENSVNQVTRCTLEIADGSPASEDFPISDTDTFIPGAEIEVRAGYEGKNDSIFRGIVLKHTIRIDADEGPVLVITCRDKSIKMTVGRKSACFRDMTDSDIISKLIGNNGLSADVKSTNNQLPELIQYYATDWDFILTRADANGLIVTTDNGKITVSDPNVAPESGLGLTYGLDIMEFEATIDAEDQFKSVQASAWDAKNQAVSSGTASLSNFDTGNLSGTKLAEVIGLDTYHLQTAGFPEPDTLNTWAKSQTTRSKYAKVRGQAKFQGSTLAKPGTLIDLKGVGKRFEGKAFISAVQHDISRGDWITTITIGLSPEPYTAKVHMEVPPAAGLLPGMQGLQIGKVVKIDSDPDQEFRVLVKLPLIQSGDDGVWARLATFYATNNAGAFFYPEVDDEVVIGFFNDDPRYPVILGSVYSSGRAFPNQPEEGNNLKAFISREQMKMTFDEEKKVITITTPGNNQLVFSDEDQGVTLSDQNGNSIKLSPSGIEINSASNITIKASESISMDGPTGITATASGGAIDLNGMNISCSADIEFSFSASATGSISASAELSISGGMVMIN
ncbi:MAG: type VI secretion system tip protein VgrG [Saprospiraceae bacterium]|nr:type VI secretion system tip protein VgrG [Lewinella sp.]